MRCAAEAIIGMIDRSDESALGEGKFESENLPDGSTKENAVLCTSRGREFVYHRNTSTLGYHLNTKRVRANKQVSIINLTTKGDNITSKQCRQSTLKPHISIQIQKQNVKDHIKTYFGTFLW